MTHSPELEEYLAGLPAEKRAALERMWVESERAARDEADE